MTKNLETADTLIKLVLAILVIVLYFTHVISGPFANALMILAMLILVIFTVRVIILKFFMD